MYTFLTILHWTFLMATLSLALFTLLRPRHRHDRWLLWCLAGSSLVVIITYALTLEYREVSPIGSLAWGLVWGSILWIYLESAARQQFKASRPYIPSRPQAKTDLRKAGVEAWRSGLNAENYRKDTL